MKTGKVELGQGTVTATMQLVADELDVPMSKVTFVQADTWVTPDQGTTAGSQSTRPRPARAASARPRRGPAGAAEHGVGEARRAGRKPDRLERCRQRGRQRPVSYADLIGGKLFNLPQTGQGGPEAVHGLQDRRDVGAAGRRPGQGVRQVHVHAGRPRARDGPRARRAPADARLDAGQGRRLSNGRRAGRGAGRVEEQLRRRRRQDAMGRDHRRPAAEGDVEHGAASELGDLQRRPAHDRAVDGPGDPGLGVPERPERRCGARRAPAKNQVSGDLQLPDPDARLDGRVGVDRVVSTGEHRDRLVLDAGRLPAARDARDRARTAAAERPRASTSRAPAATG